MSLTQVTFCGWKVLTDLPLPEALPWTGPAERPVDVTIRLALGLMPWPEGAAATEDMIRAPDGAFHQRLGPVVHVRVAPDGRDMLVGTAVPPDRAILRWPIHTQSQIPLHYARGLLTLHGGAVMVGGRAILLTGTSGRGKTTLTAAMAKHGFPFLSEEHCVIRPSYEGDGPTVLPVMPTLRLTRSAVEALDEDWATCVPTMREGPKRYLTRPDWFQAAPVPLGGFVLLRDPSQPDAPPGPRRLRGAEGVARVMMQRRLGHVLPEGRPESFAIASWLVRSGRAWEIPVCWGLADLERGVALVAETVSGAA